MLSLSISNIFWPFTIINRHVLLSPLLRWPVSTLEHLVFIYNLVFIEHLVVFMVTVFDLSALKVIIRTFQSCLLFNSCTVFTIHDIMCKVWYCTLRIADYVLKYSVTRFLHFYSNSCRKELRDHSSLAFYQHLCIYCGFSSPVN